MSPRFAAWTALSFLILEPLSTGSADTFDFDVLGIQSEDFFLPNPVGTAALSPSGARYAYSNFRSGVHWIDIQGIDDPETQHTATGEEVSSDAISLLAWKDDNRLIYQTNFGNLYLYDLKQRERLLIYDSERVAIFGRAIIWDNFTIPSLLSLLPEDPKHILITAFDSKGTRQVYRLQLEKWDDAKRLKPYLKNPSRFDLWGTDQQSQVRLGMRFGDKGSKIYYAAQEGKRWTSLDALLSGKTALAFDLSKANIIAPRDYLIGFDYDPNAFYFASNRDTDTTSIYRFRLDSETVEGPIAQDPVYDLLDPLTGASSPLFSSKRNALVGIAYDAEKPKVLWIDTRFAELQTQVDEKLPDSANLVFDWNDAETRFLIHATRGNKPHELYLYQPDNDSLVRIGPQRPVLEKAALQVPIPFQAPSRDGGTLHGYFTPAANPERGSPAPLVVLVHGGPWARDSFQFDPFAQCLSYNGFAVLQVNFRGSIGYGYKHYLAIRQNFGLGALDDFDDAINWCVGEGLADRTRVAIMGFSYGGYASALAAALRPDTYRCAVPVSGIYDIAFETKRLKQDPTSKFAFEHWKHMVASDWKDRETLDAISPVTLAGRIQIPMLIAHGELDQIAVIEHAERFQKALETAGTKTRLIRLKEEGHSLDKPRNQAHLLDTIVQFLATHLAPES